MGKNRLVKHEKLPVFFNPMSRRLFLRTSSAVIALPFITSLLPRRLWATESNENAYRKFVSLVNEHGGHWLDAHPKNISYKTVASGVRAGALSSGQLGPIYGSAFDSLKNKISVLIGLDGPVAIGHLIATPLAASFGQDRVSNGKHNINAVSSLNPDSVEVLIGRKIYASNHPIKCLRMGGYGFEGGRRLSGVSIDAAYSQIMNNLISGDSVVSMSNGSSTTNVEVGPSVENKRRGQVLEQALASLSETKKSASLRKVSSEASKQISAYQEILAQMKDSFLATTTEEVTTPDPIVSTTSCKDFKKPSGDEYKAKADLIVAALACGVTRLAHLGLPSEHTYVHRVSDPTNRALHVNYLKNKVTYVGGYLMEAMDNIQEANGKSMLENSAVLMTSTIASSKMDNHCGVDMRVLIGGGLNGKLRMGEAIDFRGSTEIVAKASQSQIDRGFNNEEAIRAGRVYNELLITIMRSFGLTQPDYSWSGKKGYGHYHIDECNYTSLFTMIRADGDKTQYKLLEYVKNVYLKNYDRDTILPYYYL